MMNQATSMKKAFSILLAVCFAAAVFAFPPPAKAAPYSVTLSASSYNVTVGTSTTITATVMDNGVLAANEPVVWSIANGPGTGNLVYSSVTDASGIATATFTPATGPAATIKMALTNSPSDSDMVTINIQNPQPVYTLSLSASPPSVAVGSTTTLTATLLSSGSPVAGKQINWSVPSGQSYGYVNAQSSVTNASGQATVALSGVQVGALTARAVLDGDTTVFAQTAVSVTAQAYTLMLSAIPSNLSVNGTATLTAILLDANQQAVANQRVNFSIYNGPGSGSFGSTYANTNANGQASVTFTATQSGAITFRAVLNSNANISATTNATIAAQAYTLALSVNPYSMSVNGKTTLTATLLDANQRAVSGQRVNFSIYNGPGTGSFSSSYANTNSYGQASVTFTATRSGAITFRAVLNSNANVSATANASIGGNYTLALSANPTTIAQGASTTFTATLKDGGYAVSGQRINWSIVSGYAGGGTLGASYSTTNSYGQATVSFKGNRMGTVVVRATLNANSAVSTQASINVTIPVNLITLSQSSLTLAVGSTQTLNATASPSNAANRAINWSSSNTSVAKVDSYGRVTAVGAGSATITATAADGGGAKATCGVTVGGGTPSYGNAFPAVSVVNAKNVAVRPNANTKGKILGRMAKGTQVRVIGYTGAYFVIPWPNATGKAYVAGSQLNVSFTTPMAGTSNKKFYVYTRASTAKRYRYAYLPKNMAVQIYGRYGSWYQVLYNGYAAYARVADVKVKNQ